ncbi:hypothetical protein [Streptomyces sp. NPDC059262]|uniref:hypothetical protein n=1 Tax=Streptomyces sp. NPDC059262 TaxID=3346797 RepID=UPI00367AF3B4
MRSGGGQFAGAAERPPRGLRRRRTGRPPHLNDDLGTALGPDLLTGADAVQGNGVEAARTSGTGHAYWRMLGHPNGGTPELSEIRDQREQQTRRAAGDKAYDTYDTAYHHALTDDAEHGLAHAPRGHAGP